MNALLYAEGEQLRRTLQATLRLRWPDSDVALVDAEQSVFDRADGADVIFVGKPGSGDGLDFIRRIRARSDSAVMVLAGDPSDEEMIDVLDAGADDYLSASLSPLQLVARVGALLRRVGQMDSRGRSVVRCGPVNIDVDAHRVQVSGHDLHLTPTEFNLLYHLAAARGGTITSKALQKLIWESDEPLYIDTLRKYVQRLRKKLQLLAAPDLDIVAVRGVGYRLAYQ